MDKVSCITITKNRVSFLSRCIDYYINQTHIDKELVIVYFKDDVDTYNFIYSFDKKKKEEYNINFYQVDSSLSLGEARNIGVQKSSGDWICIWDDDDYFRENRIEEQLKFCIENNIEGTTLSCILIFSEKYQEGRLSFERMNGWEGSLFVKKSKIHEYENLPKGEDTPMIEKLYNNKLMKVQFNPDLYIYYIHSKNISGYRHLQNIFDYSLPLNINKNREIKKIIGWL